ncbi:tRNA dihydrouridine synthase DusB [Chlamydiifrater phoenicopteri]|uniref:tRNA dihydrouridine synthase DusB n=1 Tax=Chlamydiifrater phoenicopteri TaxID=2681469 RepID=UPI001BD0C5F6|nr:tRNA dihydrouridine synthase DusB [Chlamydiifrater phoenicopteri]
MDTTIHLKNLLLDSPVVYAPLAGFSDYPYRRMGVPYGPALMFCEMTKVEGILWSPNRSLKLLEFSEDMRPIGGQICGSNPLFAAEAARVVEGLGFDLIDLNCGCPTDKITKDGSGSGMLKDPIGLGKVVEAIVYSTSLPVTVKIRSGWDYENINVEEVVRIIRESGADAVFVHGRTRSQGYVGPANRDFIKRAKAVAGSMKVFGNGDIFSPESAKDMLETTGCDGVLVARGTMGAPWIAQQIKEYLATGSYHTPTFAERKEAFLLHLQYVEEYYSSEAKLLTETRKLCGHYLVSSANVRFLRSALGKAKTREEIYSAVERYCEEHCKDER